MYSGHFNGIPSRVQWTTRVSHQRGGGGAEGGRTGSPDRTTDEVTDITGTVHLYAQHTCIYFHEIARPKHV